MGRISTNRGAAMFSAKKIGLDDVYLDPNELENRSFRREWLSLVFGLMTASGIVIAGIMYWYRW